jgi:hypothetical protein
VSVLVFTGHFARSLHPVSDYGTNSAKLCS